ncbi:hypothetical protein JAAARDRAFT_206090 [Jaapia argillacea MUCL 33604]|uniref:BRCT domain-containing protein n=1 Tax=Jaapia argillacea MUCL 33604 TaxID=933084 RepID=A0A067Q948_9AGAM|nr:hypothetical protein JAAARDRAFT_206090 [Jaapia argillacea MUCL 33604]
MSRRSNKSHKVPNVKLRPAAPQPRAHYDVPSYDAQVDSTQFVDMCPRPFKGFVICATGVQDKTTLFKQALELGAMSTQDFTDRVTHLIALEHGGAKYKCALERKIPIMKPSFVNESYEIWLRGDDVDLLQATKTHRLPIFQGLTLALSGIEDVERRNKIAKLIVKEGGTYMKTISRPVRVTHLLCSTLSPPPFSPTIPPSASLDTLAKSTDDSPPAAPQLPNANNNHQAPNTTTNSNATNPTPTPLLSLALKFKERGEADIKILWEDWFWDCVEFGGRWGVGRYEVFEGRGGGASEMGGPGAGQGGGQGGEGGERGGEGGDQSSSAKSGDGDGAHEEQGNQVLRVRKRPVRRVVGGADSGSALPPSSDPSLSHPPQLGPTGSIHLTPDSLPQVSSVPLHSGATPDGGGSRLHETGGRSGIHDTDGGATQDRGASGIHTTGGGIHEIGEEEEEMAQVKRPHSLTLHVWESVLGGRGFEVREGRLVRVGAGVGAGAGVGGEGEGEFGKDDGQDDDGEFEKADEGVLGKDDAVPPKKDKGKNKEKVLEGGGGEGRRLPAGKGGGKSMLGGFSRSASFAPVGVGVGIAGPSRVGGAGDGAGPSGAGGLEVGGTKRVFGRVGSSVLPPASAELDEPNKDPRGKGKEKEGEKGREKLIFVGKRFRLVGEARAASVVHAIKTCGGLVVDEDEEEEGREEGRKVDWIIVRLASGSHFYRAEKDEKEREKYRTECWLERCIFEERVCERGEKVVFGPLEVDLPLPCANKLLISLTNLDASESIFVRRLVKALGGRVVEGFSRKSTHLVCGRFEGRKWEKAGEWGVRVVGVDWVEGLARGEGVDAFGGEGGEGVVADGDEGAEDGGLEKAKSGEKGKGKEKEVVGEEDMMVDITNSVPSQPEVPEPLPPAEQPQPIRRTATTLIMDEDANSFGNPVSLLGSPSSYQKRQDSLPPSSPSLDPDEQHQHQYSIPEHPLDLEEEESEVQVPGPPSSLPSSPLKRNRVPSSESPSPLKIPRLGDSGVRRQLAVTSVPAELQDKITSLLGKRPSIGVAGEEEDKGRGGGRAGKRPRPVSKSKLQSRQNSKDVVVPPPPPPQDTSHHVRWDPAAFEGNQSSFDGMNGIGDSSEGRGGDESMRVMYEDPEQRAERMKLLGLFGEGGGSVAGEGGSVAGEGGLSVGEGNGKGKKKRNLVRRSARVAGF